VLGWLRAPVGRSKLNGFGSYDTAGNLFEWVDDCRHLDFAGIALTCAKLAERASQSCALVPPVARLTSTGFTHPAERRKFAHSSAFSYVAANISGLQG
jgi:formylglycine-generating enzyme required for sulfatase activity